MHFFLEEKEINVYYWLVNDTVVLHTVKAQIFRWGNDGQTRFNN